MKLLAASKVFWPNITKHIEVAVKTCDNCAKAGKAPIKCTLQPWPTPTAPWTRLHMDYAGPINGYYFLLIIDAYSKWPEIIKTRTTTAAKTIEIFADVLARHGLCELCVTDNGPQFISTTFEDFCKKQGIKHLTTAYYSSQSNGQAERFVELMKNGLHRAEGNLDQKLREFLFSYRYMPSYNLGQKSPFELMTGRRMRTKLDLLKPPSHPSNVLSGNRNMAKQYNSHHGAKWKEFYPGDEVFYQLHVTTENWKWTPGTVASRLGAVTYTVEVHTPSGQRIVRAHSNQLKRRYKKNELFDLFDLDDEEMLITPTGTVQPIIVPEEGEVNPSEDERNDEDIPSRQPDAACGERTITTEPPNDTQAEMIQPEQRDPVRENRGMTSKFSDYVTF